jgi:hypothetical protein
MPTFSLTDNLGNPVQNVKVDWTSLSSLFNYVKAEVLHLIVAPDFLARRDETLTQAAPKPLQFQFSAGPGFQLGSTVPEITITPGAAVLVVVNTTAKSGLIAGDPFHAPATVPANTGYVGMSITGSLDPGVSETVGDLTFGMDKSTSVSLAFYKAFPTDSSQPTLGDATGRMLSGFVIPARLSDLDQLQVNDVCSASGQGTLTVSGSFDVSIPTNPLATVNLPLGIGTIDIQDGVMAGVSASFALSGSYQIRARRTAADVIELSYLQERGTSLQTDFSVSAGASATLGTTDLLATLLGAIATGKPDKTMLDGLSDDEISGFNDAIKEGVNHSLQASVDLALSSTTDDQPTFQYEIRPSLLEPAGRSALERAFKGDLSQLTALEAARQADGTIAPGIRLLNSVLTKTRTAGVAFKVNLLGIVNLISLSKLIRQCEFLTEPASGDLVIKETVQSERISAITEPFNRQEALRKALFDSSMVTTTYIASKAVSMPSLQCESMHFAENQNTSKQTMADYLNWFVAVSLAGQDWRAQVVNEFTAGGRSTCLVRVKFDDAACEALFFDSGGNLRARPEYLEIGREAMIALLDPDASDIDGLRRDLLADPHTWSRALSIGPSPGLSELLPLSSSDPRLQVALQDVIGDIYDIVWWADAMVKAGQGLRQVRTFLADRDPATLAGDEAFAQQRANLQNLMAGVVKDSRARFSEPWGLVCLFSAAGSRQSYGKLVAGKLKLELTHGAPVRAAGR